MQLHQDPRRVLFSLDRGPVRGQVGVRGDRVGDARTRPREHVLETEERRHERLELIRSGAIETLRAASQAAREAAERAPSA